MAYECLEINGVKVPLPLSAFPVGSIYMSTNDVSPASFIGGAWSRIENKFLLAAGSLYSVGSEGGSATHTLSVYEMPEHNHYIYAIVPKDGGSTVGMDKEKIGFETNGEGFYTHRTRPNGAGQAHNNMPPYKAVCMWERVG